MPARRKVNPTPRTRTELDRRRAAEASMPNQSADSKYYRGNDSSVINNNCVSQRRGRVNDPLQSIATPRRIVDDRSTDQYYANGGSKVQKQFTPAGAFVERSSRARPQPGEAYAQDPRIVRPLQVKTSDAIDQAYAQIVSLLRSGQATVIVEVADNSIRSKLAMKLEFAVAREVITGDRFRDVRFGLITTTGAELVAQTFGEIDIAQVPAGKEEALPEDFGAFVNGEDIGLSTVQAPEPITEEAPVSPTYPEVAPVDEDDGD